MKTLSLYEKKDTIIHKVDPISKLLYIVTAVAIPIILPYIVVGFLCVGISLLVLLVAKVFKKVIPLISFSLLILLSVIIIQGLFNAENKNPAFHFGNIIFYQEGLLFALEICTRVINILCAFAILVLTTKPSDLIESLVKRGLSPKIGYILSSVLQVIPQMTATMQTITDAQRSRGMEIEGKLSVRMKAFLPLIGPVIMNSLISTRERSMALEVRAFNAKNKKTFLNEEHNTGYNKAIKVILVLLLILAVIGRILI